MLCSSSADCSAPPSCRNSLALSLYGVSLNFSFFFVVLSLVLVVPKAARRNSEMNCRGRCDAIGDCLCQGTQHASRLLFAASTRRTQEAKSCSRKTDPFPPFPSRQTPNPRLLSLSPLHTLNQQLLGKLFIRFGSMLSLQLKPGEERSSEVFPGSFHCQIFRFFC